MAKVETFEAYNRDVTLLHKSMRNATMEIFGPDYDEEYIPENLDLADQEPNQVEGDHQRSSLQYWENDGRSSTYPASQPDDYLYYK